ncbi:MAG: transporter [Betaproteobacteria bacterium RIFCSPLOWO2_12_FULL_63_13]|nr:MAG: transporter [Betaproteobacteria bacterium RIFCSPLOWO2_02_FULL_63_19]OGA50836.1 MAG: transporter [Betaproteobacteria bacterium RIFCSPLOWO2_12_FULL_63_13]
MAKKSAGADSVYKIVEVVGTSPTSWEEAGKRAVQAASKTLRDLRIAEVVKQDMAIENGKVVAYRTRMLLSFKYQA